MGVGVGSAQLSCISKLFVRECIWRHEHEHSHAEIHILFLSF
jgi:hypothetical protein